MHGHYLQKQRPIAGVDRTAANQWNAAA